MLFCEEDGEEEEAGEAGGVSTARSKGLEYVDEEEDVAVVVVVVVELWEGEGVLCMDEWTDARR